MIPTRRFLHIGLCAVILVLDGCSLGGLGGPYPGVPELVSASSVSRYRGTLAPPQIIYRIDENRYFEDVPNTPQVCANGSPIYYVDKILGIRSFVVLADAASARVLFTIDAANDQYLIGPVTRGNTDCSSGGGGCGGASMPYSVDAGRTWKRVGAAQKENLMVSGSTVYDYGAQKGHYDYQNRSIGGFLDISTPDKYAPYRWVPLKQRTDPNWTEEDFPILETTEKYLEDDRAAYRAEFNIYRDRKAPKIAVVPQPRRAPIDTMFHCTEDGK